MTKTILLFFTLVLVVSANAQEGLVQELDSIITVEQAMAFLESNKSGHHKIITFNEEKHKTQLSEKLLKLDKGGSTVINGDFEKVHYKVLDKSESFYYRVKYVVLDASKLAMDEIDRLRARIIAKLGHGVPFTAVAKEYSMDKNKTRGGDSGWITYGEMPAELELEATNGSYEEGAVFLVDAPSVNAYYVVQKTHTKKSITEIQVLKVIEPTK